MRSDVADDSGHEVVLDVVYDGEDLAAVAAASGLSVDEVIALHSGALYRCDFCGFAPGFAYLSGLDPLLHLPRRATPRTSVPAGSVAIAGPYTAVYPSASPGGWHLLGRTDATLWDLDADPPSPITPGTTVRFRPVDASGRRQSRTVRTIRAQNAGPAGSRPVGGRRHVLRVITAGVATSFQDRGRAGYAPPRRAALRGARSPERGPREPARRQPARRCGARDGRRARPRGDRPGRRRRLDDRRGPGAAPGHDDRRRPGTGELWAYLAVRGGFDGRPVLGSRSWDSPVQARSTAARTRRHPDRRTGPGHTRRDGPGATSPCTASDRGQRERGPPSRLVRAGRVRPAVDHRLDGRPLPSRVGRPPDRAGTDPHPNGGAARARDSSPGRSRCRPTGSPS